MGRKRADSDDSDQQIKSLLQENKELRETNRRLERQLKHIDKHHKADLEVVNKELHMGKQPKPVTKVSRKCVKSSCNGSVFDFTLGTKEYERCDTCSYRKKLR